jgi:hypothetical protein
MGRGPSPAAVKWRKLIQRWRRSPLSVAEFCRRKEITQASFYQWRKRLESEEPRVESVRFVQLPTPVRSTVNVAEMRLPDIWAQAVGAASACHANRTFQFLSVVWACVPSQEVRNSLEVLNLQRSGAPT